MISLAGTWKLWTKDSSPPEGLITKQVTNSKGITKTMFLLPGLADLVQGFGWRVISFVFPNRVRFTRRLLQLVKFSNYCYRMYKVHGPTQVVKYLKAGQLALQKAIGKDKIESLRSLDESVMKSKITRSGLPVYIPSRDRKLIMSGAPSIIRWWLTLYSVYRVIEIPGILKLYTIAQPSTVNKDIFDKLVSQFQGLLTQGSVSSMFDYDILFREARILWLETASPTHKVSWMGIPDDPKLLLELGLSSYVLGILKLLRQDKLSILFESLIEMNQSPTRSTVPSKGAGRFENSQVLEPKGIYAGKLAIKDEAAGKRRVFALVDVWTQSTLKPLHDMLFLFLKSLPNDGTFDQHASEMRARTKAIKSGGSFGYDLTAATDRLPIELQKLVLNTLIPTLGDLWCALLTQRDYYLVLPDDVQKELRKVTSAPSTYNIGPGMDVPLFYTEKGLAYIVLRYSTGQPMGALSSWAMLAVTHHLIVQLAYRRVRGISFSTPLLPSSTSLLSPGDWYSGYEVLGDDIIIFDKDVAHEYLKIMDEAGVPINVTKSVCATVPVTEFAKVTSLNGINVSALSWKMFMSGNSLMGRVNIVHSMLSKGIVSKNIIPWIERSVAVSRHRPGNSNPSFIALWTMLVNRKMITIEDALRALIDGKQKVFRFARTVLYNADIAKIKGALPGLITGKGLFLHERKTVKAIWNIELPWFKITMWKPLAVFRAKVNVPTDVEALSKRIFRYWFTALNGDKLWSEEAFEKCCTLMMDQGSFFVDGYPTLTGETPDPRTVDLQVLYSSLYSVLLEKAEHLSRDVFDAPIEMDSPTELLVDANDKIERYQEFLELVDRMILKYSDEGASATPARNIKPTELKLLKLISKMGNRPLFTTAYNLFR